MKLLKKYLIEVLKDGSAYKIAKKAGISVGYVYKLRKIFNETGNIPELGRNVGRPQNNPSEAQDTKRCVFQRF